MTKYIVVTGGAGFVGSNLIEYLIRKTLNKEGYILDEHYEAYQAIDLATEIKSKMGIKESNVDTSKNFDEVYTQRDKNILRRRSIYGVNNLETINEVERQSIVILGAVLGGGHILYPG